jgi:hypothetical protein
MSSAIVSFAVLLTKATHSQLFRPPARLFSCTAADDVGTPTGPSFDVDASCDGGRDLNLADVLGGGLLSMYGYDCVNEEPQNCLVDVTCHLGH